MGTKDQRYAVRALRPRSCGVPRPNGRFRFVAGEIMSVTARFHDKNGTQVVSMQMATDCLICKCLISPARYAISTRLRSTTIFASYRCGIRPLTRSAPRPTRAPMPRSPYSVSLFTAPALFSLIWLIPLYLGCTYRFQPAGVVWWYFLSLG